MFKHIDLDDKHPAWHRVRSLSRDENPDQINRIGPRNGHLALELLIPGCPQTIQHFRKGKLVSTKTADEAAATNQAPTRLGWEAILFRFWPC